MALESIVSVGTSRPNAIMADPFSERLRAARVRRRWSQKELARRASVATKDIVHFEEGFSRPTIDRLRRLANALEVSTDYLLGIVVAPELEIGDALYRAVGQLTDEDRKLAQNFLKILVENNNLRRDKKQQGKKMAPRDGRASQFAIIRGSDSA
ncbi:MAG: helix-turn-helix transcriptional regulator [Rhizomicrobium sp.]|jgi:transcriptional regulator with XRE-family HTH domain